MQHLVAHTSGGWDSSEVDWFTISSTLGLDRPATLRQALSYYFTHRLQNAPGTQFNYSGYGYGWLGRVIESVSGADYLTFVQRQVGRTWGIEGVQRERSLPKLRPGDDPEYDSSGAVGRDIADFPTEDKLPVAEGGGYYYEDAIDSGGGLIANLRGLVTLAQVCLVSHGTAYTPNSGIPTSMNGDRRRRRHLDKIGAQLGGMEGCALLNFQNTNGVDFAYFLNRDIADSSRSDLAGRLKRLTETITVWPGDARPRISLASDHFAVGENEGELVIGVRRIGNSDGEISIAYQTVPESARPGTDYTEVSGVLHFANDEITRTITVPILDNAARDGDRALAMNLDSASAGASTGIGSARIIIEDDEAPRLPPFVQIVAPPSNNPVAAGTDVLVQVSLGAGSRAIDRVEYFAGSTLLGEENRPPYVFTWKKPAPGNYMLTARAADDLGLATTSAVRLVRVTTNAAAVASEGLLREFWTRRPGSSLSNLTATASFPARYTGWQWLDRFESPANWGDYYGDRLRGNLVPPLTGSYTFWIAADDQAQLWLSVDDTSENRRLIAMVTKATGPDQWDADPVQQSAPIQLEAGRKYYIEALHKERTGSDHLAVGWQLPNGEFERPIPGARTAPHVNDLPRAFLIPRRTVSGIFDLEIEGGPATGYEIEASSDLEHWEPLTTRGAERSPPVLGDTEALPSTQRFYRAVSR